MNTHYAEIEFTFTGIVPVGGSVVWWIGVENNPNGFPIFPQYDYRTAAPSVVNQFHMLVGSSANDAAQKFADVLPSVYYGGVVTVIDNVVKIRAEYNENSWAGWPTFGFGNFSAELPAPYANYENVTISVLNHQPLQNGGFPPLDDFIIDFEYNFCDIDIIDTQNEFDATTIEHTRIENPTIKWGNADEIINEMMSSTLMFNMLVEDKSDAYFKALFGGEEDRFLVKVYAVNDEIGSTRILIWQGFLLADMYKEPYTNNVLWVDFEASDMLELLKNKSLKPWQYNNRWPLTRLLAEILKNTGLVNKKGGDFLNEPIDLTNVFEVDASNIAVAISDELYEYLSVIENGSLDYTTLSDGSAITFGFGVINNGSYILGFSNYLIFETISNEVTALSFSGFVPITLQNLQRIYIQPDLVHASEPYQNITFDTSEYKDKDLFELLSDICKSMCLTVYSYYNVWWFVGYNQKQTIEAPLLRFDVDGYYDGTVNWIKKIKQPMLDLDPLIQIVPPFQKVAVEYGGEYNNNLLEDESMYADDFFAIVSEGMIENNITPFIRNKYYDFWQITGDFQQYNNNLTFYFVSQRQFHPLNNWAANTVSRYATSKSKYSIKKGELYHLKIRIALEVTYGLSNVPQRFLNGEFNDLAQFAIMVNGNEVYRYKYNQKDLPMERKFEELGAVEASEPTWRGVAIFEIDKLILFNESGDLAFRFFDYYYSVLLGTFRNPVIIFESLKRKSFLILEGKSDKGKLNKFKNIKFSTALDYTIPINSSSSDSSLSNFGLNGTVFYENLWITNIPIISSTEILGYNFIKPNREMKYVVFEYTNPTDLSLFRKLIVEQKNTNVYLNDKKSFISWYGNRSSFNPDHGQIIYITETEFGDDLPEGYKAEPVLVPGVDNLKIFDIKYNQPEIKSKRDYWLIAGDDASAFRDFSLCVNQLLHFIYAKSAYKLETTAKDLIFPGEIIRFSFDNSDRRFTPANLTLNLNQGKTSFLAVENVYDNEIILSDENN